jgi:hypothetical protein
MRELMTEPASFVGVRLVAAGGEEPTISMASLLRCRPRPDNGFAE